MHRRGQAPLGRYSGCGTGYEAAYVWAAQVAAARRNGVREELIELLRAQGEPGKLPAEEREIVTYARQLQRTNRVDQATFDALKNRHGAQ
jgi:alkylhydroperoxidase family enzyme